MKKFTSNKYSVWAFLLTLAVMGVLFFGFGKSLKVQATEININKIVTIDTPELSCGEQEAQFSGTLVLSGSGWGTGSDWLVVKLDGNPILELEVNDTMTSWQTSPVSVSVGSHTLEATDYDSKSGSTYNNVQATATPVDFEVFECQKEEETPSPTPFDVCTNIDGIQSNVPDGMHINATGHECVNFGQPGVEQPSSPSTPQGQVLGTSTMAGTGSFQEGVFAVMTSLGGILTALGIKGFRKSTKK